MGLPLAVELAKRFPTIGFDIEQERIRTSVSNQNYFIGYELYNYNTPINKDNNLKFPILKGFS